MLIGQSVMVYRAEESYAKPHPGLIVADHGDGYVDANIFYSSLAQRPPMVALARVKFCESMETAAQVKADNEEDEFCIPYDPATVASGGERPSFVHSPRQKKPMKKVPASE